MLIEENIELKMNNMNIRHYRSLGFVVKMGDIITIATSQLSKGSHNKILIECDYCGEKFRRVYKDYLKFKGKTIDKDSCVDCRPTKTRENNLANYGVESIRHVKEVNDKIEATNLERYGVKNPFECEIIREKATQTTIDKYGVDNYFKIEGFQEIQEQAMLEKYGYRHYSEDPQKLEESNRKRNITMYKDKTAPTSRQQSYIYDVIGGELNYPVDSLMLDIAFPQEKIYLEFQGSGHNLDVIMGKMTEKEFIKKDINRYYYLKRKDWKMIEVISTKDLLPYPDKIREMLSLSQEHLKGSSYIVFDIDKSEVKMNGLLKTFDYGDLITQWEFRKVHENNEYESFLKKII